MSSSSTSASPVAPVASRARWVPFAYGFRPFFLAAGLFAVLAVAAWLWIHATGRLPLGAAPPQLWHGHEMIFGFIGAAIGGFLLTAVPSWTGARGFAGPPLVLATAAWLAGRLAFAAAATLPLWLLAVCELAFLPALVALIAPPLLRERNRNTPLLAVLAALWLADGTFLLALGRDDPALAGLALLAAIDLVLLLVTVIGGRIVPAFTANALRRRGQVADLRTMPWIERTVIVAMVAVVLTDFVEALRPAAPAVAAVAALAHALRLAGWRTLRTLSEPIVWVLHLAYAWLPLGLALKAIHLATGVDWAAQWLHALTIGAAATMILAVTTRAALGHTGRALVVARPIAWAYGLMGVATLVRVFGPAVVPSHYVATVQAAGALWIVAFGLYLAVYTPILLRPRIDGRPG